MSIMSKENWMDFVDSIGCGCDGNFLDRVHSTKLNWIEPIIVANSGSGDSHTVVVDEGEGEEVRDVTPAPETKKLSSLNTSQETESTVDDDEEMELSPAKKKRKSRKQKDDTIEDDESEARQRRRVTCLIALSFFPFLLASISLAAMLATTTTTTQSSSSVTPDADAAVAVGVELLQNSSAPTFAPSTVTTTYQPSPHPMPKATFTFSPKEEAQAEAGGLRPTKSPTRAHADSSTRGPITTTSPTTTSPITSPTIAPSSTTPNANTNEYCVAAGRSCPEQGKNNNRKNENITSCCSGKCIRDEQSGEKVCGASLDNNNDPPVAKDDASWCVASGLDCPKDKNGVCCSGRCKQKICV